MPKKERVLLKLSGAGFRKKGDTGVISYDVVTHLSEQIREISNNREVAIVVGGGNIWRGDENRDGPLNNQDTHVMGMLATVMNALALQNYLLAAGVSSVILSAMAVPRVAEEITGQNLRRAFARGDVVIFAGGTGVPYVTTDTCAAVRALEISADRILIGKSGVDGVYDKDPNTHKDAKFYERVSYEEIIDKRIQIMDLEAMSLLLEHKRPKLTVFNHDQKDAFVNALKGTLKTTEVY